MESLIPAQDECSQHAEHMQFRREVVFPMEDMWVMCKDLPFKGNKN